MSSEAPLDVPRVPPANALCVLRAGRLVFRSVRFLGVVTVRTRAGTLRVLKFTARSVDAVSLDVTVGRGRTPMRLQAKSGTTSTLKGEGSNGVVTLYLRKLSGTLTALGGAPIPADRTVTITPDAVPYWLAHPATPTRTITFVSAMVSQLTQSGGTLAITGPRLHVKAG